MTAFHYDQIGEGYARRRQAEPRIAVQIEAALGEAHSVINVGAGAGSYEPRDRLVVAVEPSRTMIAQRPPGAAPCVQASAEALPAAHASFDAAMAVLTMHHWRDWPRGLHEMRRVARQRIVIVTFDASTSPFWLHDYFPQIAEMDRRTMPALADMAAEIGQFEAVPVEVPHDCCDGFLGAYWRRPEAYLDAKVRGAISCFAQFDASAGLRSLAHDLDSGAWRRKHAALLSRTSLDVGYRLLTWEYAPRPADAR
ncbi:MAG TPA: class I SAM-dependent methyltransferase [Vineibacter sp.]|nr:class I SAM-dependent methyltransferase [Vineibacter sp.]